MKRVKGVIPDLWKSFESEMNKDDTDKNIVRTMKRIDAILKGEGVTIGRVEHNFALACNISEFTTKLYEWLNDDEREYVDKIEKEQFWRDLEKDNIIWLSRLRSQGGLLACAGNMVQ